MKSEVNNMSGVGQQVGSSGGESGAGHSDGGGQGTVGVQAAGGGQQGGAQQGAPGLQAGGARVVLRGTNKPPRFTEDGGFDLFKTQLRSHLTQRGCWGIISGHGPAADLRGEHVCVRRVVARSFAERLAEGVQV